MRMLTLESAQLIEEQLQRMWTRLLQSKAMIIDLRSCVGGDSTVSNFLAGGLLGGGKRLFTHVPRPASKQSEETSYSNPGVELYRGKVIILTNSNTESQPEVLAAVCKEYARACVFGERTASALNGWTAAISLPNQFARFALPYTRGVSPHNVSYEGRGISPDKSIRNTAKDYQQGRDRVLQSAIKELQ